MGIDLAGEASGLVPTKAYFDQRYGKGQWSSGVLLNLCIGQGENLVTPLQAAALMSAIGNDGIWCQPHLVQEIRSPAGKIVYPGPKATKQLPISSGHLAILQAALQGVVQQPWGTGRQAAVPGVEVAGKTGTAENPRGDDHAWFAGFAPTESPRIAVAVLVEHGGHGGSVAAPIAGKIIQAYLGQRGS
jgi:penicillin-binding protein 2